MKTNKDVAIVIYQQHIALASTDGRLFRKTVMEQIKAETGCTQAAAATYYNYCKKAGPQIIGLGRARSSAGTRRNTKTTAVDLELADEECYTVLELVPVESLITVGRTHSFEGLGLARIKFKEMVFRSPNRRWKLITGLGPNPGSGYKLATEEKILDEYEPV